MTLDEAIIHAEKAAKRNEEYAKIYAHGDEFEQEDAFKCEKCAAEHRQLAEWLKELKAHREAWMKVVSEIDQHTDIHSDGKLYVKNFDVKKIIAGYRPKEGDEA